MKPEIYPVYLAYLLGLWAWDLFWRIGDVTSISWPYLPWAASLIVGALVCMKRSRFDYKEGLTRALDRGDLWFIPVFVFFLFKLPFPDQFMDTQSYHVALQQPNSIGWLKESFMPATLATYFFPIIDRAFFPFRELFGYRFGTVFNLFVHFLIFLEVRGLLKDLNKDLKPFHAGFWALVAVTTEVIWIMQGSYYVDLLPIPIVLRVLRYAVSRQLAWTYLALDMGLLFLLKLTTLPMIATLGLLFLFRSGTLKSRVVGSTLWVAVALLLTTPYLWFSHAMTDSPVFPLFNNLFRSPLFPTEAFHDDRWGPQGLFQIIFFPILATLTKVRLYEGAIYTGKLLWYVAAIAVLFAPQFSKRQDMRRLASFCLGFLLLWEITTGYIRYALALEISLAVLVVTGALQLRKQGWKKISPLLLTALAVQSLVALPIALKRSITDFEIPPEMSISEAYFANASMLFRDRALKLNTRDLKTELWTTDTYLSGPMVGVSASVPLVNNFFFARSPEMDRQISERLEPARTGQVPGLKIDYRRRVVQKTQPKGGIFSPFLPAWNPFLESQPIGTK